MGEKEEKGRRTQNQPNLTAWSERFLNFSKFTALFAFLLWQFEGEFFSKSGRIHQIKPTVQRQCDCTHHYSLILPFSSWVPQAVPYVLCSLGLVRSCDWCRPMNTSWSHVYHFREMKKHLVYLPYSSPFLAAWYKNWRIPRWQKHDGQSLYLWGTPGIELRTQGRLDKMSKTTIILSTPWDSRLFALDIYSTYIFWCHYRGQELLVYIINCKFTLKFVLSDSGRLEVYSNLFVFLNTTVINNDHHLNVHILSTG